MQDNEAPVAPALKRGAWNKGKVIGAKPPLRPKHVWSIRANSTLTPNRRKSPAFGRGRISIRLCRDPCFT